MDRKVIRKNVVIRIGCDGVTPTYNRSIDLSFTPDVMNVKYSMYYLSGELNKLPISAVVPVQVDYSVVGAVNHPLPTYDNQGLDVLMVKSSLINDYLCPCVDTGSVLKIDTTWDIKRPVQGNYVFTIHDIDGDLVTGANLTDLTGDLVIHLEFIKYL